MTRPRKRQKSAEPLNLRPAEPRDWDECRRVFMASYRAQFPWERVEDRIFDDGVRDETLWLAEAGGRILGVVSVYLPERYIHSIYVAPEAQGQGVGKALLAQALRLTGGWASLKTDLDNPRAHAFYIGQCGRPAEWGWSPWGAWIRYEFGG